MKIAIVLLILSVALNLLAQDKLLDPNKALKHNLCHTFEKGDYPCDDVECKKLNSDNSSNSSCRVSYSSDHARYKEPAAAVEDDNQVVVNRTVCYPGSDANEISCFDKIYKFLSNDTVRLAKLGLSNQHTSHHAWLKNQRILIGNQIDNDQKSMVYFSRINSDIKRMAKQGLKKHQAQLKEIEKQLDALEAGAKSCQVIDRYAYCSDQTTYILKNDVWQGSRSGEAKYPLKSQPHPRRIRDIEAVGGETK